MKALILKRLTGKSSVCLTKHRAVKTRTAEVWLHTFLTWRNDREEPLASSPGCFGLERKWAGGPEDPRKGTNAVQRRKIRALVGTQIPIA
jgi:hypothetical protein